MIYELLEKVGELQFCPDILYLMSLHPITEQTVWQDLQQMSRNTRIYWHNLLIWYFKTTAKKTLFSMPNARFCFGERSSVFEYLCSRFTVQSDIHLSRTLGVGAVPQFIYRQMRCEWQKQSKKNNKKYYTRRHQFPCHHSVVNGLSIAPLIKIV